MNTIVTVLKTGGEYNEHHVEKTKEMIDASIQTNYRFVCLTDSDRKMDAEIIPLEDDLPGWWSKIELFRQGQFDGKVLYMDLDTVIRKDISHILNYDSNFMILKDFYRSRERGFGSGLMAWNGDEMSWVYEKFINNKNEIMNKYKRTGDQKFLEGIISSPEFFQEHFPNQIISYKEHCCQGRNPNRFLGIPEDARIICFHGKPRPWNVNWLEDK